MRKTCALSKSLAQAMSAATGRDADCCFAFINTESKIEVFNGKNWKNTLGAVIGVRLASNEFPGFGSVGGVKKNHKKSENRRSETPALLPWSLKTTRHGHQIDTNSTESMIVNFIAKRVKSKKNKPFMPENADVMLIFSE